MSRILLCLSLFLAGYLFGTLERPAKAQTGQWYGTDGSSGSTFEQYPGGPIQYYDNKGNAGTYFPGVIQNEPASSLERNPC